MSKVSSSNGLGKCPKLRFPGFDEPWNETAFEDLGNFYNGLSGKDKNDFGKGDDRYITYMNVYKNVIADIHGCDVVRIKEGEHQNKVHFGDLLFTQSSETLDEVGLTSVWLYDDTPFLNSFCFGFHFDTASPINPRFAAYSMRTPYARKRITREGQGATRYNLSSNRLKKVKILYPSHSEQDKIAGLLSLLEIRIERQCEIVDQLKKYKRGFTKLVFEKLMSKAVLQIPLSDLCISISSGRTTSPDNNGSYPLFGSTGIVGSTNNIEFDGDIVMVARVGANAGKVNFYSGRCGVTDNTLVIRVKEDIVLTKFLAYFLEYYNLHKLMFGSGQPLVTGSQLKKILFPASTYSTQMGVTKRLETFERFVKAQDTYEAKLVMLKSALMQQLFI